MILSHGIMHYVSFHSFPCRDHSVVYNQTNMIYLLPIAIRVCVAWLFVSAGYAKLFSEKEEKIVFFQKIGLKPGILFVYLIGTVELIGGAMLALGLFLNIIGPILGTLILCAVLIKIKDKNALRHDVWFYVLWAFLCFWVSFAQF